MTEQTVDRKLFEIFDEAFKLYNDFETCAEPTNSVECQVIAIGISIQSESGI